MISGRISPVTLSKMEEIVSNTQVEALPQLRSWTFNHSAKRGKYQVYGHGAVEVGDGGRACGFMEVLFWLLLFW